MWNLKESNSQKQRVEWWLQEPGRWGKYGDIGQRIQAFGHRSNKVWDLMYNVVTVINDTALYTSKFLHTQQKKVITWDDGGVNNHIAIILQYLPVSNHHIVHLKLTQCYVLITSQRWKMHLTGYSGFESK